MTTRKRLRTAVWIVLSAIAGLAGVSYLHPCHTRISWSDSRVFAVTLGNGHLRVMHISAELNASYLQDSPLEEYADACRAVPKRVLFWSQGIRTSFMQTSFKETPISYTYIEGSVMALLALILALFLIAWTVKRRRQLAGAIREIIRPSDR